MIENIFPSIYYIAKKRLKSNLLKENNLKKLPSLLSKSKKEAKKQHPDEKNMKYFPPLFIALQKRGHFTTL